MFREKNWSGLEAVKNAIRQLLVSSESEEGIFASSFTERWATWVILIQYFFFDVYVQL